MSELVKELLSVADALDYAPSGEISHAEIVIRAACLSIEEMQKQIAQLDADLHTALKHILKQDAEIKALREQGE